jgi:hypothetical protein
MIVTHCARFKRKRAKTALALSRLYQTRTVSRWQAGTSNIVVSITCPMYYIYSRAVGSRETHRGMQLYTLVYVPNRNRSRTWWTCWAHRRHSCLALIDVSSQTGMIVTHCACSEKNVRRLHSHWVGVIRHELHLEGKLELQTLFVSITCPM